MTSAHSRPSVPSVSFVPFVPFFLFVLFALCPASADDWPQWRGPKRDGVWRETGITEKFDKPQIAILWRVPINGGYCGPTVAKGGVYVMDRPTTPTSGERILCFNADNGAPVWSYPYECDYGQQPYPTGPRASVTIDEGRAYTLGTRGHFHCLDAAKGTVLWKKDLVSEYQARIPQWGLTAAPLIEGPMVIQCLGGANGACLVAFDKRTGAEKWRALDDRLSYSAPIVIEQAGKRVLVYVTGDRVVGLAPLSGELYWSFPFAPIKMPICVPTPVFQDGFLFVTSFYDGSLLLKVAPDRLAVEQVWRRKGQSERQTDALHCMISTPLIRDGYIYGVDSYGQLRCLDLKTGDRVWENLTATRSERWSTIHLIAAGDKGDKVWMFNELGELIISRLTPKGFDEISRAKLIEPTTGQLPRRDGVCWTHPAFANKRVYVRNDKELVCASLSAP